jgi:hypothetical protein
MGYPAKNKNIGISETTIDEIVDPLAVSKRTFFR